MGREDGSRAGVDSCSVRRWRVRVVYMEACVYSMMCRNRDEFWRLEAEQDFRCDMQWEGEPGEQVGYKQLRDWMLAP